MEKTVESKATVPLAMITPQPKTFQWTYDNIVKDIMSKNKQRKLCLECSAEPKDDDETWPLCIFYHHERDLTEEREKEMLHPNTCYKDNKEQGARLACYKLFTLLEHGRLGRSRRRPLPVCVEAHIKMMSPSSKFTGYSEIKEEEKKSEDSTDDDTWEGTGSPLRSYKKPKLG